MHTGLTFLKNSAMILISLGCVSHHLGNTEKNLIIFTCIKMRIHKKGKIVKVQNQLTILKNKKDKTVYYFLHTKIDSSTTQTEMLLRKELEIRRRY